MTIVSGEHALQLEADGGPHVHESGPIQNAGRNTMRMTAHALPPLSTA